LLEQNAAEQLAKVDWDELNVAISAWLDKAQRGESSAIRFPGVFKVAACVAAAAVVLIAVMVKTEKPEDLKLENGTSAVVRFIEAKGSALVEITHVPAESRVLVDVGAGRSKIAKCDIEIVDVNGDLKERANRAAWIIISRPEPAYADNGVSSDVMNFLYLF
ncbi:MAG: hypothetical protein ACYSW4_06060, partial [Planctomycetota bacterium]